MKLIRVATCLVLISHWMAVAQAQPARWTRFTIPETGTSVDIPSSIFSDSAGPADGYGQRFRTADGRANLTVQSAANAAQDSPAAFLAKKHPPSHIQYQRITPRFFAVSSVKGGMVWYNRCNFAHGFVHCVLINYPAAEEHAWNEIVTRVSLSLNRD